MRVPSIGLPLDERLIVREGYRIAEQMMANYRDPPSAFEVLRAWLASGLQAASGLYRRPSRD